MAPASAPFLYVIALGSNRCHGRHGRPERVLAAALAELEAMGMVLLAATPPMASAPIGPSLRTYANAACLLRSGMHPPDMLSCLKRIERRFGRRTGQRWGSRVLDLDIILWSGGRWRSPGLSIPHSAWQQRRFVAVPVASLVPDWRDPRSSLTTRQIAARLLRHRPLAG